jgi:hypothetical protein
VAGLALLVGLPAYLSTQPAFFKRYPAMADKYGPWAASTHVEAGCEGCHVAPRPVAKVVHRVRMIGVFYSSLVSRSRAPSVLARPTNSACLACHSDLRSVSPDGDLQIPHRAHINVLKMECVSCHQYLVHELSPEGKHTPTMEGCLTCHDGDTADDACTSCHTEKAAPAGHANPAWLVEHAVKAEDPACAQCHAWRPDWCVECHSHRPRSPGDDWRSVHGEQVARHRNCEACHVSAFCVRCHGDVPQLNFDPSLELVE